MRLQEVMPGLTPREHRDHVFAKFWRAGSLHDIVSSSCDNAKFRITPHLQSQGQHLMTMPEKKPGLLIV